MELVGAKVTMGPCRMRDSVEDLDLATVSWTIRIRSRATAFPTLLKGVWWKFGAGRHYIGTVP